MRLTDGKWMVDIAIIEKATGVDIAPDFFNAANEFKYNCETDRYYTTYNLKEWIDYAKEEAENWGCVYIISEEKRVERTSDTESGRLMLAFKTANTEVKAEVIKESLKLEKEYRFSEFQLEHIDFLAKEWVERIGSLYTPESLANERLKIIRYQATDDISKLAYYIEGVLNGRGEYLEEYSSCRYIATYFLASAYYEATESNGELKKLVQEVREARRDFAKSLEILEAKVHVRREEVEKEFLQAEKPKPSLAETLAWAKQKVDEQDAPKHTKSREPEL